MNGISFAEFESSSFDNLYSNGFANAKHLDEVGKQLARVKPGDWASKALSEATVPRIQAVPAQTEQTRVVRPAKDPARHNGLSRTLSAHQQQQVPLNDMGVMPGSRGVDPAAHAWRPSQEAHARARNAPTAAAVEAPRVAPSSNQGAFVGWKSN
mmetsp:Transcript_58121/g.138407  ORF Transcript_58121/g.138407 Transcript_58121/m.138407 type:complete len:154 (-) Transcript_58121:250-711(-)|eukprot:CAMPEP_0181407422 /NCGR_PEP_ID=MMETSP1110-20121109/5774_1 /TAXON_ID=174948 /ORGANISM="Symbiodinium sp., Strain CCMP421" /LENGTH=153 /DNA_ID=CAMNT_0023529855 /DNA_START=204 /DNA_END=665 /DNA_ORIENTATION=+